MLSQDIFELQNLLRSKNMSSNKQKGYNFKLGSSELL